VALNGQQARREVAKLLGVSHLTVRLTHRDRPVGNEVSFLLSPRRLQCLFIVFPHCCSILCANFLCEVLPRFGSP
jgi:hypothetical protein